MPQTIAIVGANLAGGRAAAALRQSGFEGHITLIGEERWPPYERPPLSKEVLWDNGNLPETFFLQDEAWYSENRIDLRLGARAESLDLAGGAVTLQNGSSIKADRVLLTTGGAARRLPLAGADAPNVHHLRTKDDADHLAKALVAGARIVVIGMGVIGAEVAASARKAGCEVVAIEPAPVAMVRTIGERFGGWLSRQHSARGVDTRFGIGVEGLALDSNGRVAAVNLSDTTQVTCDAVVVGIGIVPAVELARDAGLAIGNGIIVDKQCSTSNPHVFAAGDVAEQPDFFGGRTRLETYQNAAEQGAAAAAAMLGQKPDFCKPCWFWSDQYDINLQVTGRINDSADVIVRGDMDSEQFTALFLNQDVVEGVITINRPADMGVGKRLVERRIAVSHSIAADDTAPLRTLLAPPAKET